MEKEKKTLLKKGSTQKGGRGDISPQTLRSENNKLYYQKNKERIAENKRRYYQKNKEKFLQRTKEWYENNKEDILFKLREKYHNDEEYKKNKQSKVLCNYHMKRAEKKEMNI